MPSQVVDLVHVLAFQVLKFWKSLRQSTNGTLYSTSMCFGKEREIYSCVTRTSLVSWDVRFLNIILVSVLHVTLLSDWLFFLCLILCTFVGFCVFVCTVFCVCLSVCVYFRVFLPIYRINVFIMKTARHSLRFSENCNIDKTSWIKPTLADCVIRQLYILYDVINSWKIFVDKIICLSRCRARVHRGCFDRSTVAEWSSVYSHGVTSEMRLSSSSATSLTLAIMMGRSPVRIEL